MSCNLEVVIEDVCETVTVIVLDNPCSGGGGDSIPISAFPDNQLERRLDGYFVPPVSWNSSEW